MTLLLLFSDLQNQDRPRETEACLGKGPVSPLLSQHFESRSCGVFHMVQSDANCGELGQTRQAEGSVPHDGPPSDVGSK